MLHTHFDCVRALENQFSLCSYSFDLFFVCSLAYIHRITHKQPKNNHFTFAWSRAVEARNMARAHTPNRICLILFITSGSLTLMCVRRRWCDAIKSIARVPYACAIWPIKKEEENTHIFRVFFVRALWLATTRMSVRFYICTRVTVQVKHHTMDCFGKIALDLNAYRAAERKSMRVCAMYEYVCDAKRTMRWIFSLIFFKLTRLARLARMFYFSHFNFEVDA